MNLIFSRWTRALLMGCMVIHGGIHAVSSNNEVITITERNDGPGALLLGLGTLLWVGLTYQMAKDGRVEGKFYYALAGVTGCCTLLCAACTVAAVVEAVKGPRTMLKLSIDGFWHWEKGLITWDTIKGIECILYTGIDSNGRYTEEHAFIISTRSGDTIATSRNRLSAQSSHLIDSIRKFYTGEVVMKHESVLQRGRW